MSKQHGTPLSKGNRAKFVGAAAKAISLVADKLDPKIAAKWATNNDEALQNAFLMLFKTDPGVFSYPVGQLLTTAAVEKIRTEFAHFPRFAQFLLTHQRIIPVDLGENFKHRSISFHPDGRVDIMYTINGEDRTHRFDIGELFIKDVSPC